jgi:hypothetical protein
MTTPVFLATDETACDDDRALTVEHGKRAARNALAIANELGLDVSDTMRDKMQKNEQKYPAAQYRGRYGPEDDGRGTRDNE